MRSWRLWLRSCWAHVEVMWSHLGGLGRLDRHLSEFRAARSRQEAARRPKEKDKLKSQV